MTLLYPRLLKGRSKDLATEYRELDIESLTARWSATDESAVYVATGGARAQVEKLTELRRIVLELAQSANYPDAIPNDRKADFDLALAETLHRTMELEPAEAAAGDVWAFLALVLMPDIAHWRYPNPPGDRVRGSDLTRHVFGRLWWRAQLVHAPGDMNPYGALKVLGEAAFDQIYARRTALGGSPHLITSILRVWNSLDLAEMPERGALRDFLKRLLRLAPFVLFEAVDAAALDAELRAVAYETIYAMQIAAGKSEDEAAQRADSATRTTHTDKSQAAEVTSFAGWLANQLTASGMTVDELADKLGYTRAPLSAWLSGRAEPRDSVKQGIAELLGSTASPSVADATKLRE